MKITEIIKAHVKETVIVLIALFLCATAVFCFWYYGEGNRYKIVQIQNRAYKIDRKTGETWATDRSGGKRVWRKITPEKAEKGTRSSRLFVGESYTLEELKQEKARMRAERERQ